MAFRYASALNLIHRDPFYLTLPCCRTATDSSVTQQILFGVIVLGLSGHLVATQVLGGAPSATNYNVFLGIWIIVIAAIGILSGFLSMLAGIVMMALDALSVLFTFAGGVVRCSCTFACFALLAVTMEN